MPFQPLISLDVECLSFQDILHEVSISFLTGQMVGIVGPNGAGKSTLLRMIAGIWRPSIGKVMLNRASISTLSTKEKAIQMAYLPQQMSDDCPYTVREFVEMGRFAHQTLWRDMEGHQAVLQAISQMGLDRYADVPICELSGGERQRVGIARCLAQKSRVLILDEPISNLDINYQLDILERLRAFASSGYLVILSIHHLEFAVRYCTNLVLLKHGIVYAQGKPDTVLTDTAMEEVFTVRTNSYRDPFGNFVRFSYRPLKETSPLDYDYQNQLRLSRQE